MPTESESGASGESRSPAPAAEEQRLTNDELAALMARINGWPSTSRASELLDSGEISQREFEELTSTTPSTDLLRQLADARQANAPVDGLLPDVDPSERPLADVPTARVSSGPESQPTQADPDAATMPAASGDAEAGTGVHSRPNPAVPPVSRKTFSERFKDAEFFKRGGMGQVWRVRDQQMGREVVAKELLPEFAGDARFVDRLVNEAKLTGRLEHPAIVPVYELVEHTSGRLPFYVMRYVRGRTLGEAIAAYHRKRKSGLISGGSSSELVGLLQALMTICNAVAYAHGQMVTHRDLKPGNVILGDFGEVMVLDWGLAKERAADNLAVSDEKTAEDHVDDPNDARAINGPVEGTAAYMPLEQAQGKTDQVNALSDVYSLGAVLYAILTGRAPYHGRTTGEVLRAVIAGPPAAPRTIVKSIPKELEAICLKAMARKQSGRYSTPLELAADIKAWIADETVGAYREPWQTRLARWCRRHRTAVWTAASTLLGVAIVSTIALLLVSSEQTRTRKALESTVASIRSIYTRANGMLAEMPGSELVREAMLRDAWSGLISVLEAWPNDRELLGVAAEVASDLGGLMRSTNPREADLRSQDSVAFSRRRLVLDEHDPASRVQHAAICLDRAELLLRDHDREGAEALLGESTRMIEPIRAGDPRDELGRLVSARLLVLETQLGRDDLDGDLARRRLASVDELIGDLADAESRGSRKVKPFTARGVLIDSKIALARNAAASGLVEQAREASRDASEVARHIWDERQALGPPIGLAATLIYARSLTLRGELEHDLEAVSKAIELLEPLLEAHKLSSEARMALAEAYLVRADLAADAEQARGDVSKGLEQLSSTSFRNAHGARMLDIANNELRAARVMGHRGDLVEAQRHINRAIVAYDVAASNPALSNEVRARARGAAEKLENSSLSVLDN